MNTTAFHPPKTKPTLLGYATAASIIAVLALVPFLIVLTVLWAVGPYVNGFVVYGICFAVVGGILWWIRQHLPHGFG